MLRIALLDRHPAVHAGIRVTVDAHPGLAFAGAAAGRHELWPLLHRTRPDVLVVEHAPGVADGLGVCLRVASQPLGPRVVVSAPTADAGLVVPATLAGAGAIVEPTADLRVLVHTIRVVAAGGRALPAITPRLQAQAAARLGPRDRAIFAMRLADTSPADIGATVGLSARRVVARLQAIVATLAVAGDDGGTRRDRRDDGSAHRDRGDDVGARRNRDDSRRGRSGELPGFAVRPAPIAA
jgi:DNA-binding NarL/FixJ family response regulator